MSEVPVAQSPTMDAVINALNTAFSDRFHSLAQYILDARPYTPAGAEHLLHDVAEVAAFDHAEAERLARLIEDIGGVPQVSVYDHNVAQLNYLDITYLRNVLRDTLDRQRAAYESKQGLVAECPPARDALDQLVAALNDQVRLLSATA